MGGEPPSGKRSPARYAALGVAVGAGVGAAMGVTLSRKADRAGGV